MYLGATALISPQEKFKTRGQVDMCSRPGVDNGQGTSRVAGVRFSLLIAGVGCTLPSGLEMALASCGLSLLLERRLHRGGLFLLYDLPELPDLVFLILKICINNSSNLHSII